MDKHGVCPLKVGGAGVPRGRGSRGHLQRTLLFSKCCPHIKITKIDEKSGSQATFHWVIGSMSWEGTTGKGKGQSFLMGSF